VISRERKRNDLTFKVLLAHTCTMKLTSSDVTSCNVLGNRFCVSRKKWDRGRRLGAWLHLSLGVERPWLTLG